MKQTLAQMYLTCGWLEAIFFGMNCVLFAFCIYVLWGHAAASRRILLLTSLLQFLLAAARASISVAELLQALTYPIYEADSYYSDPGGNDLFIAGFAVYVTNSFIEELLLIWRLYVLYDKNIKICIPSLIIWVAHVCVSSVAVSGFEPLTATSRSYNVHVFSLAGWGLETGVNLLTTLLIARRLWKAARRTAGLSTHFDYKSSILIVIECGALITTSTTVMFILYSSGHPVGIVGIGIATQLATISPLLIIARFGIVTGKSHVILATDLPIPRPIEVSVVRTEHRVSSEFPMKMMPKRPCALDAKSSNRSEDEHDSTH
ncbi:hypothetical protein PAXRUDRAFT_830961 [Paxillus rubicundulus Ve08.2h10]|uniref:Uncharacterized protein n=1 Tax=Paxillus rubicundulus Ve08.2h10 TaxID=930991 RepID=A0A0D0E305_9AGAM|nr:hypothetical protein PAXRUDRAFT_830961 [Paxillus rubicundulus Ve08.2h10]